MRRQFILSFSMLSPLTVIHFSPAAVPSRRDTIVTSSSSDAHDCDVTAPLTDVVGLACLTGDMVETDHSFVVKLWSGSARGHPSVLSNCTDGLHEHIMLCSCACGSCNIFSNRTCGLMLSKSCSQLCYALNLTICCPKNLTSVEGDCKRRR